ncbi:peptidase inhibitor I42 (plasmid) [Deinococcus aetherius]|uniref:Peptidase inhibitor I42 n=1 Tax=Deinococcus aetherius TaxID=200252 RepID=A0ABM8AK64_9DEIO|nr:protease inhibitor I42 family protein [Deinococcus aetherius]BDP44217.1 peptidase inhibitor I42 [Deinococcus aetherius]
MRLTQADDGRHVTATVGETLTLTLPETPGTGYRWSPEMPGGGVLHTDEGLFTPGGGGIGGGGTRTFEVRAVGAGEATLRLALRRAWEGEAPPERTFTVTVTVR